MNGASIFQTRVPYISILVPVIATLESDKRVYYKKIDKQSVTGATQVI